MKGFCLCRLSWPKPLAEVRREVGALHAGLCTPGWLAGWLAGWPAGGPSASKCRYSGCRTANDDWEGRLRGSSAGEGPATPNGKRFAIELLTRRAANETGLRQGAVSRLAPGACPAAAGQIGVLVVVVVVGVVGVVVGWDGPWLSTRRRRRRQARCGRTAVCKPPRVPLQENTAGWLRPLILSPSQSTVFRPASHHHHHNHCHRDSGGQARDGGTDCEGEEQMARPPRAAFVCCKGTLDQPCCFILTFPGGSLGCRDNAGNEKRKRAKFQNKNIFRRGSWTEEGRLLMLLNGC